VSRWSDHSNLSEKRALAGARFSRSRPCGMLRDRGHTQALLPLARMYSQHVLRGWMVPETRKFQGKSKRPPPDRKTNFVSSQEGRAPRPREQRPRRGGYRPLRIGQTRRTPTRDPIDPRHRTGGAWSREKPFRIARSSHRGGPAYEPSSRGPAAALSRVSRSAWQIDRLDRHPRSHSKKQTSQNPDSAPGRKRCRSTL
jgi:hypothetical protein